MHKHKTIGTTRVINGLTLLTGVTGALASTLDVVPTFTTLAKVALPTDRSYDGLDLGPLLRGQAADAHDTLFHPDQNGNFSGEGREGSLDQAGGSVVMAVIRGRPPA
jgi:arylsulfatase A-like enzyme